MLYLPKCFVVVGEDDFSETASVTCEEPRLSSCDNIDYVELRITCLHTWHVRSTSPAPQVKMCDA